MTKCIFDIPKEHQRLTKQDLSAIYNMGEKGPIWITAPSDAAKLKIQWHIPLENIGPPHGIDLKNLPGHWTLDTILISESRLEFTFTIFTS